MAVHVCNRVSLVFCVRGLHAIELKCNSSVGKGCNPDIPYWHSDFNISHRSDGLELTARCVIQPSSLNFLGGTRKRISLPDIRGMSALEVSPFHLIALYTNRHFLMSGFQRYVSVDP